ncbi:MAG: hypothetical protein DMF84_09085 [Acidobacteria bacterium]|nr:MAG: hypothetical protein DMF84_09085 [Acidobacteriota bacterium]
MNSLAERSRNDRAYDLAERIGEAMESETDLGILEDTLAFVAAALSMTKAYKDGEAAPEAADRFMGKFVAQLVALHTDERLSGALR